MPRCSSGDGCTKKAVESSSFAGLFLFCKQHQKRLDNVKSVLGSDAWAKDIRNKEKRGNRPAMKEGAERFCATPGCPERPLYISDFCLDCQGEE